MTQSFCARRRALAVGLTLALGLPAAARAVDQEILYTQVQGWSIVAHKLSGQFDGCSTWSEQSGFVLRLFNSGRSWDIGTNWNPGDQVRGAIEVDGNSVPAVFVSTGEFVEAPITGPMVDTIAAGYRMRLILGGNALDFSLAGSRNAINAVFDCLRQPW